jgi:hypothetical protein
LYKRFEHQVRPIPARTSFTAVQGLYKNQAFSAHLAHSAHHVVSNLKILLADKASDPD